MIALDLGLTTTGAVWYGGSDTYTCPAKHRRSPMTEERKSARLAWWHDTFTVLVDTHGGPVYVEAPFISRAHPNGAMELLRLHGVLAGVAYLAGVDLRQVENRTLKRWATGKSNATKDEMMDAARARGWTGADHNQADAYLVWSWAREVEG